MFHWPIFRTARPAIPAGRRVYAVGDVHGRLDLLDSMLTRIAADHAERGEGTPAYLLLLGDLIDRGPDSAGVVLRAMSLREPFAGVAVLRGNHEQALLDALEGDVGALTHWLSHGGDEALRSWGVDLRRLSEADPIDQLAIAREAVPSSVHHWLLRRPLSGRIGDYLFVHAGIRPGVPLDEQLDGDMLQIRGSFLSSRRDHGAMVVHGHSIRQQVDERPNRIGIDTGAWRTGVLTALALEGTDRWYLQTGTDAD